MEEKDKKIFFRKGENKQKRFPWLVCKGGGRDHDRWCVLT
jgi:hypothetical protein